MSLLGRLRGLSPRATVALAFAVAFAAALIVTLAQSAKPFLYDSREYWGLGGIFTVDGHFSLLNFNSALRGYALPLINHVLHLFADWLGWQDSTAVKVFNAAIFGLLGTVVGPALAASIWPEHRWGLVRRLLLAALFIVFWSGYLAFPLSDFPALLMAMTALVAASRSRSPGWLLLCGVTAALAINMRPAYVLLAPIVVVLVGLDWWTSRRTAPMSIGRRALCAGLLLAAFVVVTLPQSLATHRHYDSYAWLPGSTQNLSSFQLTVGMRLQRYETFVGPGKPAPQMNYIDHSGDRLLQEQDGGRIDGSAQYLGLTATHPLTMLPLFGRHLVNGLDVRYTTPYIEKLDSGSHRPQRLVGFALVFLALLRLLWPAARRGLGRTRWPLLAAIPAICLTSVPSAMETRFLLPIYLFCYLLVLAPGWPDPRTALSAGTGRERWARPLTIGVGFVLFMALVWNVASAATGDLQFGG